MKFIRKDEKGQCIFEINDKKGKISMKYLINDESEGAFRDILNLIVKVIDGSEENLSPIINTQRSSSNIEGEEL